METQVILSSRRNTEILAITSLVITVISILWNVFVGYGRLVGKIDAMQDDIIRLEDKMDKGFESVDKRFEQVEKRFEQVDKRFDKLENKIDNLEGEFHKMDIRITALEHKKP